MTSTARTGPSPCRSRFARELQQILHARIGRRGTVLWVSVRLLATAAALLCVLLAPAGGGLRRSARAVRFRAGTAHRDRRKGGHGEPGARHAAALQPRGPALARTRHAAGGAARAAPRPRLEPLGAARHARHRRLGPALGGQRRRRAVPAQPARARPAAALRERGLRAARPSPGARRPGARAGLRDARRVGGGRLPAAHGARLRQREGGARAPHRLAQRLRARGVGGDRAVHLPLSPQLQRLERHRLPGPGGQVRRAVRGPRRRARPGGDRGAGAGLQLRDRRHREHRRPHQRRGHAGDDGGARALHPLEARRARPAAVGNGHAHERGRLGQPLPGRARG